VWTPSPWAAYAPAIGLVILVMLVRAASHNLGIGIGRAPLAWIAVLTVVLAAAAWVCGLGPGLTATILAAGYALWEFVLPLRLSQASFERLVALVLLLLAGIFASLVSPARTER
jgi:hypothetical protein